MNQIKQGYKQTKVGIIPEDWEVVKVGEVIELLTDYHANGSYEVLKDNVELLENEEYSIMIRTTNFEQNNFNSNLIYINEYSYNFLKKSKVYFGDIIINKIANAGATYFMPKIDKPVSLGMNLFLLRVKNKYSKFFIYSQIKKREGFLKALASGTSTLTITKNDVRNFRIPFPSLKEQEKIAEILTTCDETINKQEELIEAKIKQKKALSQKLLSGEVRFGGFTDEWEDIKLGEIIKEINFKTTISNQYEVLSVTKNGIYSQQEHFNKQIASEDNTGYKIVKYGNLVFSSMNLWMGSLDILRNYDIGIVSPAYKVFEIDYTKFNIDFIQHYLKSHYMIWLYNMNSEQGASIVRRNLDLNSLLTTKVKIPSFDEQSKIGEVLNISDKELDLLKKELEELKEQKKALMQKLLTGEVRVNV